MRKKTQATGFGLMFLGLILGMAFAGAQPVGYSVECTDGIDNDGNLDGVDSDDMECLQYPYADGNGETHTLVEDRYLSSSRYSSLLDYHLTYSQNQEAAVCTAGAFGYYNVEDNNRALEWINENQVDCSPYMP